MNKPQHENIMACPIPQGDNKQPLQRIRFRHLVNRYISVIYSLLTLLPAHFVLKTNNCSHVPTVFTVTGRRGFSYAAPSIWNEIPVEIRNSPSLSSFKKHLKTHQYGRPIDHYIFVLWFLLLSFFPRLISAVADWVYAILLHMVCPQCDLGYRSETCCTRLAEIQDAKKSPKIATWAPLHNFVGLYLSN